MMGYSKNYSWTISFNYLKKSSKRGPKEMSSGFMLKIHKMLTRGIAALGRGRTTTLSHSELNAIMVGRLAKTVNRG